VLGVARAVRQPGGDLVLHDVPALEPPGAGRAPEGAGSGSVASPVADHGCALRPDLARGRDAWRVPPTGVSVCVPMGTSRTLTPARLPAAVLAAAASGAALVALVPRSSAEDHPGPAQVWAQSCATCHSVPDPALSADRTWTEQVRDTA
jgi:hypothetical protein